MIQIVLSTRYWKEVDSVEGEDSGVLTEKIEHLREIKAEKYPI